MCTTSYEIFRGTTKGEEREQSGLVTQEQKWTKNIKAINHVNRLLVH